MLALLVAAAVSTAPQASEIDRLAWMSGCWIQERANGQVEEHWMAPRGGIMLGMSRTLREGKLRGFEHMRIAPGPEGRLAYVAKPSGQAETAFPLREITTDSVVFEEPAHDFPQRILYRRADANTLVARIEGQINGQSRAVDYPYKRCPSGN
jgi:hypothetical protein